MTKKELPKYCYRRGRSRHVYYCPKGERSRRIHAEPGTKEFAIEYAKLLNGTRPEPRKTIKGLIQLYMQSDRYDQLAANTRKGYMRHFKYLEERLGKIDPSKIRRVHVVKMRDALAEIPTTATHRVRVLSVLLEHAIDIGWLDHNPAKGVRSLKGIGRKREPWPADMVQAFRDTAPPNALLLFEMLIGTGQRVSDVLAMKWSDVTREGIKVVQEKTDARVIVPPTRRLSEALSAAPRRGIYIVTQDNGRPASYQLAYKWITEVRKEIGAMAWDLHSLRHTAASEIIALPGMTLDHVQSITGHSGAEMARHYSKSAEQRARAVEAQKNRT